VLVLAVAVAARESTRRPFERHAEDILRRVDRHADRELFAAQAFQRLAQQLRDVARDGSAARVDLLTLHAELEAREWMMLLYRCLGFWLSWRSSKRQSARSRLGSQARTRITFEVHGSSRRFERELLGLWAERTYRAAG
jgi:hypothetical protein